MLRFITLVILLTSSCIGQVAPTRELIIDVLERKKGTQVEPIAPENFAVKLNGKPVTVLAAERKQIRPKVAIVLDTSGSMAQSPNWKPAFALAASLVQQLTGRSDVSLVLFGDKLVRIIGSKSGSEAMIKELVESYKKTSTQIGHGRTQLRDSVLTAINMLHLGNGDAVVIITDGGDNFSHVSDSEFKKILAVKNVRFFGTIFTDLQPVTPEERKGPELLEEYATITGGESIMLGTTAEDAMVRISSYTSTRLLAPCVLRLATSESASGKLSVKFLRESDSHFKSVRVIAPAKLYANGP
jgi:hypothetical protein